MSRPHGLSRALAAQLFGTPALSARPAVQSACPERSRGDTLTEQAARWADHALATSPLPPSYVVRKALDAVAFSLRHGLRDVAVPSKLIGVAAHQHAVEALALYDQLPVADRPRLIVSHGLQVYALRSDRSLQPVGQIQPKHAAWLAPLLGHGVAVHVQTATGLNPDGTRQAVTRGVTRRSTEGTFEARGVTHRSTESVWKTLGVNIRISGLAFALDSLALAQRRQEEPAGLTLVRLAA